MNDAKNSYKTIHNCARDSRKMYKIIKKKIGRNSRSDVSYNIVFSNIETDDPSTIADYSNQHFKRCRRNSKQITSNKLSFI